MKHLLVGVDIGGTAIKIGIFTDLGNLIEKFEIPTDVRDFGNHILSDIFHALQAHVDFDQVKGIGFGVPGPVHHDTVLTSVNLGWTKKNVKSEFLALLGREDIIVHVSNDANVATAGELYRGAAQGYQNAVMFTLGTGIGGGIVVDGKIVDGLNGMAGEVGHVITDFEHGFACNCGKKGCLETVASATGIVRLAQYRLEHHPEESSLSHVAKLSAKKVIDAAKSGDPLAIKVMEEAANNLAYAMAFVTHIVNPGVIVLGGGVSNAGQYLIDLIEPYYYRYVRPFIEHTNFVIAKLGNDAGIYGAAYMVKS